MFSSLFLLNVWLLGPFQSDFFGSSPHILIRFFKIYLPTSPQRKKEKLKLSSNKYNKKKYHVLYLIVQHPIIMPLPKQKKIVFIAKTSASPITNSSCLDTWTFSRRNSQLRRLVIHPLKSPRDVCPPSPRTSFYSFFSIWVQSDPISSV